MSSQKTQEEKINRLASDPAVQTQKQPESGRRRANSDRPGKLEDVPGSEQQQEPTTSQSKGDVKQEKDGREGEVHGLDSKLKPPGRTNETEECMQQRDMKNSEIRQEKYIERELTDHHRSESALEEKATTTCSVQAKEQEKDRNQADVPSSDTQMPQRDMKKSDIRQEKYIEGELTDHLRSESDMEEKATTSCSVQAKEQEKDRNQADVPSSDSQMPQQDIKKCDIRPEKYRDKEQAGDHHRSDSESLDDHGHLNPNVEEEATTSQYEQDKKQWKDRRQGEGHKLDSKPIPPRRTDKTAEWQKQRDMKKSDIRQEKYIETELTDHHRSESVEKATTSWSEQAKEQEKARDQGDVPSSDSKLDLNEHIYEKVQDDHRPEFVPKPPNKNVSEGEQRPPTVPKLKNKSKTGLEGDKGRPSMTLVFLGQSGSGKSASGNTILGKEVFESCISSVSVTTQCEKVETQIFGIHLTVIDTPDLFSDDLKERDKALEDCKSLIKATTDHKYLLVMQLGRFTDGEREILPQIKAKFGKEVVQNVIILFTHAKELNGKTLEEYVAKTDTNLQDVIKECGSRFCAFENTVKNPKQVKRLFDIICEMEGMTRKKAEKKECSIS